MRYKRPWYFSSLLPLFVLLAIGPIAIGSAEDSVPVPLDAKGLPLWEHRSFTDFPVHIELEDRAALDELLRQVPVASFHREQIDFMFAADGARRIVFEPRVTGDEAAALTRAGYQFERIEDLERLMRGEIERTWKRQAGKGGETQKLGAAGTYHTHAQIGALLAQIESDHSAIADTFVWGQTVQGRSLWGVRISSDISNERAKPEVRLASTMHGNEPPGMEMLLYLADYLTDNYGTDSTVTYLVDNFEVHIMPLLNPDGYIAGTRTNKNRIDLNRNYPVPDGTIGGDFTWTEQVETIAFKSYGFSQNFVISENGHSGALVVNYPWDYKNPRTPDDGACIELSLEYSSYNLPMYNGSFPQGITNGYDWYLVKGSLQDWAYEETGCIDVTIEYSNTKWPDATLLDGLWDENRESFLHWIAAARFGLNGVVTDQITGLPISATIQVTGNSKAVSTDPDRGDYYKLLDTGTYEIIYSSPGYLSDTLSGVSVTWGEGTVAEVALVPETATTLPPGAPSVARLEKNRPNPFNPATSIRFEIDRPTTISLMIYDSTGRLVRQLIDGERIPAGSHAIVWHGIDNRESPVSSGVYHVRLIAGRRVESRAITLIR